MARVSVLMAAYNAMPFITNAVQSILTQTLTDFDLIVVRGPSKDGTDAEIDRLAQADSRIRIGGRVCDRLGDARNELIRLSRSDLLAWMDADDVSDAERLSKQIAYMGDHPECVALGTSAEWIDAKGHTINVVHQPIDHEGIDGQHMSGSGGGIYNSSSMVRRAALLSVGGYRGHYCEDYDLWLRLAEVGRLANLPEVLFKYRIHGDQATFQRAENNVMCHLAWRQLAEIRRQGGCEPSLAAGMVTRSMLAALGLGSAEVDCAVSIDYANSFYRLRRLKRVVAARSILDEIVSRFAVDGVPWAGAALCRIVRRSFELRDVSAFRALVSSMVSHPRACARVPSYSIQKCSTKLRRRVFQPRVVT